MPQLGDRAKDKITNFVGVVTGECRYISGCNQVLLAPVTTGDGAFRDSQWFDAQRVEVLEAAVVVLDNGKTPGADKAAPKR